MNIGEQFVTGVISVFSSIGLIGFVVRSQNDKIKEHDEKIDKCMLKTTHEFICDSATAKTREHITKEITHLKDEIFKELRNINKA